MPEPNLEDFLEDEETVHKRVAKLDNIEGESQLFEHAVLLAIGDGCRESVKFFFLRYILQLIYVT